MSEQFDVIVIGSGAGGGTLAHRLASHGKKVLILERGEFLPREKQNWNTVEVFQKDRYHTNESWLDASGNEFRPGIGYWVGGNTKVYGSALFRLREKDFEVVHHKGGLSPEWIVKYDEFEPYYTQAEKIYQVRGTKGTDPTEPPMSADYPHPPVLHEERIQGLHDGLIKKGYKPFYVPLGVHLNETNKLASPCIRCDSCDGFPCLVDAKSDSDISCIRPAMQKYNLKVQTGAKVLRLLTQNSKSEVSGIEVDLGGKITTFSSPIIILAAGAANSAAILLRSANDKNPKGLGNNSDQVGRNFMKHNNAAILGVSFKNNRTTFQKTLAFNDFYWGDKDFKFPMGHVSLIGKANGDMLAGDAPFFTPRFVLNQMAALSVDWWLTNEDLPDPENRIRIKQDKIVLEYKDNNVESFDHLLNRWTELVKEVDDGNSIFPKSIYLRKKIPLAGVAHQVGTCRFGDDPKTSVLDRNCKSHDIDNLYVVDGSFFPSSGAVNPSLTIMANALRVADQILTRLK